MYLLISFDLTQVTQFLSFTSVSLQLVLMYYIVNAARSKAHAARYEEITAQCNAILAARRVKKKLRR